MQPKVFINTTIEAKAGLAVKRAAEERGISVSRFLRELIEAEMTRRQETPAPAVVARPAAAKLATSE